MVYKKIKFAGVFVFVSALFAGGSHQVNAYYSGVSTFKSASQTINVSELDYIWSWLNCSGSYCRWVAPGNSGVDIGLVGAYATIGYAGYIQRTDVNTGMTSWISNTSITNLNVGDTLVISPGPLTQDQIYWNGTGEAQDSPYGAWVSGAGDPYYPLYNYSNFYLNTNTIDGYGSTVADYFLLSVAPPAVTISTTGSTAGLSCNPPDSTDNGAVSCLITSPGSVAVAFNYASTYGHFYFADAGWFNMGGFYDTADSGDYTLLNPISYVTNKIGDKFYDMSTASTYYLPVAAKSITETFKAVNSSAPPTAPVITGPTTGYINTPYQFGFVSTDPANENLIYQIDWNDDGTVDQVLPADVTQYYPSGTQGTTSQSWASRGSQTFEVRAQDVDGNDSSWTTYTTAIVNRPPTAPTISPDQSDMFQPGKPESFHLQSMDPDNDRVTYTVTDWGDGSGPSSPSGAVPSGSSQRLVHTYANAGTYVIQAKSTDTFTTPTDSPIARLTIDITQGGINPLTPSVSLSVDPDSITTGNQTTLLWSTSNIARCSSISSSLASSPFGTSGWDGSVNGSLSSGNHSIGTFSSPASVTYTLNCTATAAAGGGPISQQAVLDVTGTTGGSTSSCTQISNAGLCSGEGTASSGLSPSVVVSSCNASPQPTMCEFTCSSGYHMVGSGSSAKCVASSTLQEQ